MNTYIDKIFSVRVAVKDASGSFVVITADHAMTVGKCYVLGAMKLIGVQ